MERTNKEFIGRIGETDFAIIDSWFPIGVACVTKGKFQKLENTRIEITTRLHLGFRILFGIWVVLTLGIITIEMLSSDQQFTIVILVGVLIMIILFSLFLHGIYVLARNRVIKKIERIVAED
jgi:hypothetical protein